MKNYPQEAPKQGVEMNKRFRSLEEPHHEMGIKFEKLEHNQELILEAIMDIKQPSEVDPGSKTKITFF